MLMGTVKTRRHQKQLCLFLTHISQCPQLPVQDSELAQHLMGCPVTTTRGYK